MLGQRSHYLGVRRHAMPRSTTIQVAVVLFTWAYGAHSFFERKVGLLDDAFIYLHVAANVLDTGMARFFPLSESTSLVASSPLRLCLLLPATAIARLLSEPRSIEAARATLFVGSLLTCFAFLPFYRRAIRRWLTGTVAAGILTFTTESALQMEGLLIFWCSFTALHLVGGNGARTRSWNGIGTLAGLGLLTRPDFGIPLALALGVVAGRQGHVRTVLAGLLFPVLVWVVVAVGLRVYPLPTTYYSKVVTGVLEVFVPRLGPQLATRAGDYILFGSPVGFILPVMTVYIACAAGSSRTFGLAAIPIALYGLLLAYAPGNYVWYFEGLLIAFLATCLAALLLPAIGWTRHPALGARGRGALFLLPWCLLLTSSGGRLDRAANWSFDDGGRGAAYQRIGQACEDDGSFRLPDLEPSRLGTAEIGIISFVAGPDAWLIDHAGIAQPGTLKASRLSFLRRFYPRSALRSAEEELRFISSKLGDRPLIWNVWWFPPEALPEADCAYAIAEFGICLAQP